MADRQLLQVYFGAKLSNPKPKLIGYSTELLVLLQISFLQDVFLVTHNLFLVLHADRKDFQTFNSTNFGKYDRKSDLLAPKKSKLT